MVRPSAENMRGSAGKSPSSWQLISLLGKSSFAPINPAIRAKIRPMQIVGATSQRLALVPFGADVGYAIVVRVRQLPNAGRRGNIDRSVVPHASFRKHHLIGKHRGFIEMAAAFCIFEPDDAMRFFLQLLIGLVIRAGGVGDIEAALLIEGRGDGPLD